MTKVGASEEVGAIDGPPGAAGGRARALRRGGSAASHAGSRRERAQSLCAFATVTREPPALSAPLALPPRLLVLFCLIGFTSSLLSVYNTVIEGGGETALSKTQGK